MRRPKRRTFALPPHDYDAMLNRVIGLIDGARRASARTVNAIMTATYWLIGRHIVEFEQQGKSRADYGEELLARLAVDLTTRCGRGFQVDNLQRMRLFYFAYPASQISATLSRKFPPASINDFSARFPLSWSAYVLDGLPNKILATEYRTVLPDEKLIADEIEKTRHQLEARRKSISL
ncbi:MAG TPA: DUF1016 N-terminal domain-containing protein [Candidatus Udaeobacter sp.]|nr:DUF1016 N-terminal domain-containing protein [Candidatus Udaeobacter sp.]